MSLSINKPSFVKVDTSPFEKASESTAAKSTHKTLPSANKPADSLLLKNDSVRYSPNDQGFSVGAFAKLFDMLDLVFKTMREMLAGRNISPEVLSNNEKTPDTKVNKDVANVLIADTGNLPKLTNDLTRLKADLINLPKTHPDGGALVKVTPDAKDQTKTHPDGGAQVKVTPDGKDQTKTNADGGAQVKVTPDAKDQTKTNADGGAQVKVTPDGKDQTKTNADGGAQVKVTPDAKDQAKTHPDVAPRQKVMPGTVDQTNVKTDLKQLSVLLQKPTPAVPQPTINVTNESSPQVRVEVNVGHCHCPDTPRPGITPRTHASVVPQPEPAVVPKPDLKPQPAVTPQPDVKVVPHPHPHPEPAVVPKPDLKPRRGVTPQPDAKVVPQPQPEPAVVPKPDLKPQPGVTPPPDLTSPGPAENQNDRGRREGNDRPHLRA